jgi:hypothetical protein
MHFINNLYKKVTITCKSLAENENEIERENLSNGSFGRGQLKIVEIVLE